MSHAVSKKKLFDLYDELDRIEELVEDMIELKIDSKADAERRMLELNDMIDELEEGS